MKSTSKGAFEVRCHRCDVSYPVETKRCLYCGEKPSAGPPRIDLLDLREVENRAGEAIAERASPGFPRPLESGQEQEAEVEEEVSTRQALPRVLMSLVWVILLVVVSVYRACTG
ncbi:MAG: hypothetical protein JRG96_11260 [Deltaproteobacteria bacterium]|nr:hypothetical protein [Deltaproteobacteria bacterium]MBW2421837.1 hypothetical protein [Deltaproteobacteria bacterium]